MPPKRIGIVGFGHLGQFLKNAISKRDDLEVVFVWNRSPESLQLLDESLICRDLEDCGKYSPDVIVEVAHPDISKQYGETFLAAAHYLIGSPSALADESLETKLRSAAVHGPHGLYVPSGAFWGAQDISRMADLGTLKALTVTMRKHPSCFKLGSPLKELNESVGGNAVTLYDGPVRQLCPLAPNNVNTMAAAAIAAHNLGFDTVKGRLISDPASADRHVVTIDAEGPGGFVVSTERSNPASAGAVTGTMTYNSFLASVLAAGRDGHGVHLC